MTANYRAPEYKVITPARVKPISTSEFCEVARLSKSQVRRQSHLIDLILAAVTECAEGWTRRTFINTEFQYIADFFPGYGLGGRYDGIELRRAPVQSIEQIEYLDTDNAPIVIDPSDYYLIESDDYGCVMNDPGYSWPTQLSKRLQGVRINFIAGYGDKPENVPQDLRLAMLEHANYFFHNRGDCACNCKEAEKFMPADVRAIYDSYKILLIGL